MTVCAHFRDGAPFYLPLAIDLVADGPTRTAMRTAAMWGVAILAASATAQTADERLTALEATQVQMLHGAGTTNPSKLFWELLGLMTARARFPVHATYRAVGSSTGQKEFLGASNGNKALNHFGAGDIPMSADRYNAVVAASRAMVHVPFALGGIGVFHSAPVGGASVHLTACVLAKIFSRQITTWDHADIKALNTDVALPSLPIKVVHRVEGSSSTAGFTAYMLATCPADWTLGTGSTITWPEGTFEGQGSDGMSTFIEENEGAIGYIDAGHGHEHGLSEVALKNKDGVYLTTKTADIGAAATEALNQGGLIPTDPSADWSSVNLYDLAGATTWPITMISYFYLEKDLSGMDAQTAALVVAFVKFVLSAEGQEAAEEKLFVKLPAEMQTYNTATLDNLTLPAGYAALSVELASNTLIEVGAGMNMLSGKRREYGEWDRDRMEAQFEAMQATIAQLESQIKSNNKDDDFTERISIAAIALGVLGLVLALVALILIAMNKSTAKPVQREISFGRTLDGNRPGGVEITNGANGANGSKV